MSTHGWQRGPTSGTGMQAYPSCAQLAAWRRCRWRCAWLGRASRLPCCPSPAASAGPSTVHWAELCGCCRPGMSQSHSVYHALIPLVRPLPPAASATRLRSSPMPWVAQVQPARPNWSNPRTPPAGPFFSWPAVFLPGEQASVGFSFINSCGAVGGFIGPWVSRTSAHWSRECINRQPQCGLPHVLTDMHP